MPPGPGQNQGNQQGGNSSTAVQLLARQVGQLNLLTNVFTTFMGAWSVVMRDHGKSLDDISKAVTEHFKLARDKDAASILPGGDQKKPDLPVEEEEARRRNPLNEIANAAQQTVRTIPMVGNSLAGLVGAFRQAVDAVSGFSKRLQTPHRLDNDPDARKGSSDLFKRIYDTNDTPGGTKVATVSKPDSGMQGMANAATAIAGIASAASAATSAFQSLVGVAVQATQALSPGTVMAFNLAMRDLTATFGVALQPIVQTATTFSRMFAATILPVMDALRPVVQQLGESFLSIAQIGLKVFARLASAFMPVIDALAEFVVAMEPLFKAFATITETVLSGLMPLFSLMAGLFKILEGPLRLFGQFLNALSPIFEAFTVITRGVAEALGSLFTSIGQALGMNSLKDTFGSLKVAVMEVAKGAIIAAAAMAKMLGMDSFIDGMLKALSPEKRDARGLATVQNPVVGDLASYLQNVTRNALLSGAGGGRSPEEEQKQWRNEVAHVLKKIESGAGSLETIISNAVDRAAVKMAAAIMTAMGYEDGARYFTEQERAKSLDKQIAEQQRRRIPGAGMVPGSGS